MSADLYKLNLAFFSVFGQQNGKFHITHSALLLFTNKVHKDVRKYFFSYRVVLRKDLLDNVTANAKTVNSFKSRLEKEGSKDGSIFGLVFAGPTADAENRRSGAGTCKYIQYSRMAHLFSLCMVLLLSLFAFLYNPRLLAISFTIRKKCKVKYIIYYYFTWRYNYSSMLFYNQTNAP